jgi:glycogen synthase
MGMRIAFLTPEFITDYYDGGGLGNYLSKVTKCLTLLGHTPEVFVSSPLEPRLISHEGIRVERVPIFTNSAVSKIIDKFAKLLGRNQDVPLAVNWLRRAFSLAEAMERRHSGFPFDAVQSADLFASGIAVRSNNKRTHVVRCSSAVDLYNQVDMDDSRKAKLRVLLERAAIKRADLVYAPSQYIANYYQQSLGLDVKVVRPPVLRDFDLISARPDFLPERFFVHYGQLIRRKGTFWLVNALKKVFLMEPSFRIILIGRGNFDVISSILSDFGEYRSNIQVLYPMPKQLLYRILSYAEASVLPSLVDNLPNTVIESLMFGVPVIGTLGASIDELVENGVTGELVHAGDEEALANSIVRVWRKESKVQHGFTWDPEEFKPEIAAKRLLQLVEMAHGKT